MADIPYIEQAQEVKITGQDSGGTTVNYVSADANGNLAVKDYADGTPGSAVPSVTTQIGGSDGTDLRTLSTDTSGNLYVNIQDGSAHKITSTNNGNANDQVLHTGTPDTTTTSTALGALNASIQVSLLGLSSVGFQLAAGTFIGTIQAQCSIDGGTTWQNVTFYDPANSTVVQSLTFASSNTLTILAILPIGGASHARVTVSAYTSGTANALMRASQISGAAGAVTAAAFGTVNNTSVSVPGNTATLILAANSNRKYAYISNTSGSSINIQFGSSTGLSTTVGLIIISKSYYELKGDNLYTGNVYAYSSGAVTLSVTEGTP